MKKMNEIKSKDKLILFIILAIAAGFFVLQPILTLPKGDSKQTTASAVKKEDTKQINCDSSDSKLSRLTDNQEERFAPEVCLFVGCNGFTY